MKSFIAIVVVTMAVFAKSPLAQAQECQQRLDEAERQIRELQQQVTGLTLPKLTGILKSSVSQYEAERICRDRNMRLPTARELALVVQYEHGAEGISETKKDEYRLIRGTDGAGNPDHFYFSNKGYKRPAGHLGNHWFWSSSVHPDGSNNTYKLDGYDGEIYDVSRTFTYFNAVRCVQSR